MKYSIGGDMPSMGGNLSTGKFPTLGSMGEACIKKATPHNKGGKVNAMSLGMTGSGKSKV